jgi:hypothetical protein
LAHSWCSSQWQDHTTIQKHWLIQHVWQMVFWPSLSSTSMQASRLSMMMANKCKTIGEQVLKPSNVGSNDTHDLPWLSQCSMTSGELFPLATNPGSQKFYSNNYIWMETQVLD